MTAERRELPYLRLVEPTDRPAPQSRTPSWDGTGSQHSLFSDADGQTLGFIEVSEMEPSTLLNLLHEARPRYIFDLRQVPDFTKGKLSRRAVFSLFENLGITYFDVAGYLGAKSPRDTAFNPRLLIPNIMENLVVRPTSLSGPALFFLDPEHMTEPFIEAVAIELPAQDSRGWRIAIWQISKEVLHSEHKRDIVFISHANPQDNDIARWFASRLVLLGYKVWTDITRLVGGELFWDTIEDIIRHRAARVVVLLSEKGHQKPGVLDEINIAVSVERRMKLDGFVIPVRIDDLPFGDIRANIARKNIIDGSGDLNVALRDIFAALEAADVPRSLASVPSDLGRLTETFGERGQSPNPAQWDRLIHNQIRISAWPKALRKYNAPRLGSSTQGPEFVALASGPGGAFSFATLHEIEEATKLRGSISRSGEIVTSAVLAREIGQILRDNPHDLSRALTSLTRSAWDEACRRKGLLPYVLANNNLCWFPSNGFNPNNRVSLRDANSKTRQRSLVGSSKKKKVYWHFGIEAKVVIGDHSLRLKPHVIFTEDGVRPIDSISKQHSLRRSFCRNWWNDRWRDLLMAILHFLADGNETWDLPVSPSERIVVTGKLTSTDVGLSSMIGLIDEPPIDVGFDQKVLDPRKGLALFGPVKFDRNPKEIRIGVVGTSEGLDLFRQWCAKFKKPVQLRAEQLAKGEVAFPGFGAAFAAQWPPSAAIALAISRNDLLNTIRIRDRHQAVYKAVDIFVAGIEKATREDDPLVDIWFVVIPDEVYLYGRPNAHVPSAISIAPVSAVNKKVARRFSSVAPSLFDEDNQAAKIYEHHADFHHQLKSRLLKSGSVTQIFRESSIQQSLNPIDGVPEEDDEDVDQKSNTASLTRRMQSPSDVAWNIGTASFFKAGGRPWRVATARPGVCYVGLIFKHDELGDKRHACCGAQLFLDSGEGIVFKGTPGPWYSPDTKQFHLTSFAAETLMSKVIEAFKSIHSIVPREIFVHGRTRFSDQELNGFADACAGKSEITGVRITRTNDYKLFGSGDLPVRRGTYQKLTNRVGLIWTSGFVNALNTYQGRETPNPLRVELCGQSKVPLDTVLRDIMTLTKMNFNTAVFADGYPVTMRFADAIGDVLMATGDREVPPLPFRHYI
ncbi:TIR domain-containing protein [Mesorhizobium sp. M0904]|uniref:TIR domain-containing protein n=1 Tax=Mesorhizobium sp. M0904 TaxID=2957022 RepID=UPI00333739D5